MDQYVANVIEWWPYLWFGVVATLQFSVLAIIGSLFLGLLLAYLQLTRVSLLRLTAKVYVEFMRGVPLIALLFLLYFGLPSLGVRLPPFVAAVLALTLNSGAYASELIRVAIQTVPRGIIEAADSLGLSPRDKAQSVVLPLALRTALPPLVTLSVNVLKDSSVVSTIAVADLMLQGQILAGRTLQGMQVYITIGIIYVVLTAPLLLLGRSLERRYSYGARPQDRDEGWGSGRGDAPIIPEGIR